MRTPNGGAIPSAHEIFEALSLALEGDGREVAPAAAENLGDREVSIVPVPLGLTPNSA